MPAAMCPRRSHIAARLAVSNGCTRRADGVGMCRGHGGPHDAGNYNSFCWETGFFVSQGGNWDTPYGHFFLSWYSGMLVNHADRVLAAAADVLNKHGRPRIFAACREVRPRPGASAHDLGLCIGRRTGCASPCASKSAHLHSPSASFMHRICERH
jgi:hypothetical protein